MSDSMPRNEEAGQEREEMAASDERLQILNMVSEGKITAEEAAKLLEALGQGKSVSSAPAPTAGVQAPTGTPRWFRVRVTDTVTGKSKASVTIPLSLMDWGLKIGAQFAPQVDSVNLEKLGQVLRSEGGEGKLIDVVDEEDGEHVEIFVE